MLPPMRTGAQPDHAQTSLRFDNLQPKIGCQREESELGEGGKQQFVSTELATGT
jgi:hypothetical protein